LAGVITTAFVVNFLKSVSNRDIAAMDREEENK